MQILNIPGKMINKVVCLKKNTRRLYWLMPASFILLQSCSKELKAPEAAPLDPGVLSASKDTVIIKSSAPSDEAVRFSWTATPNSLITYSLILSSGTKADTVTTAVGAVSKSFTNGELNNILVKKLGLAIGAQAQVKAMVVAFIAINGKKASTNEVNIKVTPAATGPAYSKLWIVGDATPNGWNIDNPNQLTVDPANPFQFKYNQVLKAGEFKFPVSTGNWGTDYFMPPTNHPPLTSTAVQLTLGGNPDNKWQITTPGAYKILLNISASPFISIKSFTPYSQLWMVGDATPAGWNIDNPTPMTPTPGNPYEFTYTGLLKTGEFKIPTTKGNWGTDYFMPQNNHQPVTETGVAFVPGGNPDNKWQISVQGNYKVTLNQLQETITIIKL